MISLAKTIFVSSCFLFLLLLLFMGSNIIVTAEEWLGGKITVVLHQAEKFQRMIGHKDYDYSNGKFIAARFQSGQYTVKLARSLLYEDKLKFTIWVPAADELTAHSTPSRAGVPLHQMWTVLVDCAAIATCHNPDRKLECANVNYIYAKQRKEAFPKECLGDLKLELGIVDAKNNFVKQYVQVEVSKMTEKSTPRTNWSTFFTEKSHHNIEIDIRDYEKYHS